jgi:hypothetical protein
MFRKPKAGGSAYNWIIAVFSSHLPQCSTALLTSFCQESFKDDDPSQQFQRKFAQALLNIEG